MNNRKIITFGIVITLLVIAVGASVSSYAYLRTQVSQTKNNAVTTLNCLSVSLSGSNDISLTNAYAISDTDGKAKTPYTFTITNNCTTSVAATISLVAQSDSTINTSYVRYAFNLSGGTVTSATLGSSSKVLASNVTLGSKASKTYQLRLWIIESATYAQAGGGKKYSGKIKVDAVPNN